MCRKLVFKAQCIEECNLRIGNHDKLMNANGNGTVI